MKKSPTRLLPSSIFDSRCMMYHRPPHPGHDRARAAAQMRSSDSINASYDFKNRKKPPAFIAFQQTPTGGHSAALAQAGKGIGDPVIVATACKGCSLPKAESKTAVLLRAGKVAGTAVTAARARLALT
jgi:hypothetical protein